jgi:hypothetical protein
MLKKLATDDNMMEMKSSVTIGKEYIVDIDTIRTAKFLNTVHNKEHEKEIVNEAAGEGFIPTELIEIQW